MSTDISSARPTNNDSAGKTPADKVMRIATMTKQLLDEVRTQRWIPQASIVYEPSTPKSSVSCSPISPPTYAKNCSGSHCR